MLEPNSTISSDLYTPNGDVQTLRQWIQCGYVRAFDLENQSSIPGKVKFGIWLNMES